MGWFKNLMRQIFDPSYDSNQKGWAKMGFMKSPDSGDGTTPVADEVPSALDSAEAQELAARKLARLSKFFTSPLGLLGSANTGSQKLFS